MNFNGKFWHKPGHLGMTRAELLEKLNNAGGGNANIDIIFADITTSPVSVSKSYTDIMASVATNAVILIAKDNDRTLLFRLMGADSTQITFECDINQLQSDDNIVVFTKIYIFIASDNTISIDYEGPYKASVTAYTP